MKMILHKHQWILLINNFKLKIDKAVENDVNLINDVQEWVSLVLNAFIRKQTWLYSENAQRLNITNARNKIVL